MQNSEFFLISKFDGKRWLADEIAEKSPIPAVRKFLGGRWERSSRPDDPKYGKVGRAFFNGERRVLVLAFPPGKTRDQVMKALKEINEGREDTN